MNDDAPEKKVQHLSIFLIKRGYSTSDDVIRRDQCLDPVEVPIAGFGKPQLFVKKTEETPPKWTWLFREVVDRRKLAVPGVCGALFIEVRDRRFVLTFGQAGRFLLKEQVHEERFGLLCALNAVDPKTFRCVDVQALDAIQSHTRIQSGQETTPDQFGLDVEQDMLKAIVGAPRNPSLGGRVTGSDSLSLSVRLDLSDLPPILDECLKLFESELSEADHQWVYNIAMTKNVAQIAAAEGALSRLLADRRLDDVWLSVPEIIDWATVKGFMYTYGSKEVHLDVNFPGFLKTIGQLPLTLDLLRSRHVQCADADHNAVKSWSVWKCLYAEVDVDGQKYVLNDGQWFRIEQNFVARTNKDFAAIPMSMLKLPAYQGGGEGGYNRAVAAAFPQQFVTLDGRMIMHGGGHGSIEVCDLLSVERQLIHVKVYSKSAVLSHLFSQGFVSGQLIQIDGEFRGKVRGLLGAPYSDYFHVDRKPAQDELTIVYAVISESEGPRLRLPFFSMVNLVNTRKILLGYGFKVELLKIPVDEVVAKTTKLPPNGKPKHRHQPAAKK